jgi:hypothetical protein
MKYIGVPMTGLAAPTEAEIGKLLGILEGGTGGVFLHCKRGADRTGVVIASYRIDHDGWDNTRALSEAMARGMSLFQVPVRNISWPSNPERWSRKQRRWRGASSRPSSRKCSRREPASGPARLEKEDITFPVEALASIHAGRDRTEDGASCHPL